LSVADNASASPRSAQLSGTGDAPQPGVTLAPGALSFSGTDQGRTSSPRAVTLTNSGAATLHITSIALSGARTADFLITSTSCHWAMARAPRRSRFPTTHRDHRMWFSSRVQAPEPRSPGRGSAYRPRPYRSRSNPRNFQSAADRHPDQRQFGGASALLVPTPLISR